MKAVVTDVKYRMAISLIRDLSDEGIEVCACHSGKGRPFAFSSNRISRSFTLPEWQTSPKEYLDQLYGICHDIAQEGEKPALLPVGAGTLGLICQPESYERFKEVCNMCLPAKASLDLANDKGALARLAKEIGVPVPADHLINSPEELDDLPYPLVIKPVCGEKQGLSAEQRYAIVRSPEEAKRAYEAFTFDDIPPVVQDCLEGDGLGYSVVAKDGRIINAICHRRIREYPLSGGPSTCCVTINGEGLRPFAEKLIEALNYSGLAMIEFKLDKTGQPFLLEINPRVWGTFPLTRVSGSSLAYDWFALAMGVEPIKKAPKEGVMMYYLPSDIRRGLAALKKGHAGSAFSAVGALLSPKAKEGVFEFGDLKGSMAYLGSYLKRGL